LLKTFQYYLPIKASPTLFADKNCVSGRRRGSELLQHALNEFNVRFIHLSKTDWLTAKLLLTLGCTVILGSESHETHDRILPSHGSGNLQANIIYTNPVRTLQGTHDVCATMASQLMLFRETAVYFENERLI
jgi:hypothetical protein